MLLCHLWTIPPTIRLTNYLFRSTLWIVYMVHVVDLSQYTYGVIECNCGGGGKKKKNKFLKPNSRQVPKSHKLMAEIWIIGVVKNNPPYFHIS